VVVDAGTEAVVEDGTVEAGGDDAFELEPQAASTTANTKPVIAVNPRRMGDLRSLSPGTATTSISPPGQTVTVCTAVGVTVAVFVLRRVGTTMVIDASYRRRRRPVLTERLRPYASLPSLADEAESWLKRQ
jgi:hypothetical protein